MRCRVLVWDRTMEGSMPSTDSFKDKDYVVDGKRMGYIQCAITSPDGKDVEGYVVIDKDKEEEMDEILKKRRKSRDLNE